LNVISTNEMFEIYRFFAQSLLQSKKQGSSSSEQSSSSHMLPPQLKKPPTSCEIQQTAGSRQHPAMQSEETSTLGPQWNYSFGLTH